MRIAARSVVGDLSVKWVIRDSVGFNPVYQNHYLIVRHSSLPDFSRFEFMGHREDLARERYEQAVRNATAHEITDDVA